MLIICLIRLNHKIKSTLISRVFQGKLCLYNCMFRKVCVTGNTDKKVQGIHVYNGFNGKIPDSARVIPIGFLSGNPRISLRGFL